MEQPIWFSKVKELSNREKDIYEDLRIIDYLGPRILNLMLGFL